MDDRVTALRMERQCLSRRADEEEYKALYRDMQPGQNVYWNGFGEPPCLVFRAGFDDTAFNRERQRKRELIKGRFAGGNLGWILPEDLELFGALYRKPLKSPDGRTRRLLELIEREGPLNIQAMKEETGLLVKEITPVLHRLQEAFLIYEDQYDGEWDRGWCRFSEMFTQADLDRYTRGEALRILLRRFARRLVWFEADMARSFYKLPARELKAVLMEMEADGELEAAEKGYWLRDDAQRLRTYDGRPPRSVLALHRNDFLVRASECRLREVWKPRCESLPYDHDILQYLLIDGEFRGVVTGHFRNGPYDLEDVIVDLPEREGETRQEEILDAVRAVNFGTGNPVKRYRGRNL